MDKGGRKIYFVFDGKDFRFDEWKFVR
jgi:hypothetical protein